MKKENHFFNRLLLFVMILFFVGCSSDDGMPENNLDLKQTLEAIHKIEVISHQGHLHGKNFHGNAQPEKSPYLRSQVYVLQKNSKGSWEQITTNKNNGVALSKPIIAQGASTLAFEFIYYNKEGKRINTSFSENSSVYQTLFEINSYTDNKTKEVTQTPKKGKELVSYEYRDTNPENKMYHGSKSPNVKLTDSKLGLKGYFNIVDKKISFDLNVTLLKYKATNLKKDKGFYVDVKEADIDKSIKFTLPINLVTVTSAFDDEMEEYYQDLASYFGVTVKEMEALEDLENLDSESSSYWM